MTLPPSPPVWSPIQQQQEAARDLPASSSSSSSGAIAIAQHQSAHLQPVQRYSRSLSNYSSSAPSHHDYLAAFRTIRNPEMKLDDDDTDDTAEASGGLPIKQQQRGSIPSALELSKSPTILGMLTQQQQQQDAALLAAGERRAGGGGEAGDDSFYRRPSLVDSHIAEGVEEEEAEDDEDEQHRGRAGDRERKRAAAAAASSAAAASAAGADDLQFSISLDAGEEEEAEEAAEDGDDSRRDDFISDALY